MISPVVPPSRPSHLKSPVTQLNVAQRMVLVCEFAFFAGLPEEAREAIVARATTREFERDETLFLEGHPARHLVLLQSGSAKMTQTSASGNEVILRVAGKGDLVTMPPHTSSQCHSCSAHAIERCSALAWEFGKLAELIARYPQIESNISRILTARLSELQEQFREVATEKVAQRLAFALLRLMKQVGKPSHGGVKISLSREDLAQMTGTTLFTISRLLSQWGEEGFVLPLREAVVVLDAERLGRMAKN